ncbi:hypothetical protein VNO77_31325 [Canavalia gladiata]|uniref:Uncharacterized protein n=1 Tax=Canavalia gladiata TaxID=3824 RepID=A0AAN9Q4K9_CANGL
MWAMLTGPISALCLSALYMSLFQFKGPFSCKDVHSSGPYSQWVTTRFPGVPMVGVEKNTTILKESHSFSSFMFRGHIYTSWDNITLRWSYRLPLLNHCSLDVSWGQRLMFPDSLASTGLGQRWLKIWIS